MIMTSTRRVMLVRVVSKRQLVFIKRGNILNTKSGHIFTVTFSKSGKDFLPSNISLGKVIKLIQYSYSYLSYLITW